MTVTTRSNPFHDYKDLIQLFNQCFVSTHQTQLECGDDEPVYLPANKHSTFNRIIFAHGFFSSALHECAHWFIAGSTRRTQLDYGYWYIPDGRTVEQQTLFQQVEIKPQAIEWILSEACQFKFQFSLDNLGGDDADTYAFKEAVHQQKQHYHQQGLPPRAELFRAVLDAFYNHKKNPCRQDQQP